MPSEHYSEKFRLDIDDYNVPDNHSDDDFPEEIHGLKIEKLSQRVTLITILIPILIAVIVVVSYLDIKQKVVQTQTTGTIGVQNLSKDLESRFSSLSLRQASLEDEIKKQTEIFDKNQAEYAIQRKKFENKITGLTEQTADKKELKEITKRFDAVFETLHEEIAAEHKALESIETSATQTLNQVKSLNEETQQKFETISKTTAENAELVAAKLDKKQLDLALKIRDLKLQEQFQQQTDALRQEISRLNEKNDKLSVELNAALKKIKEISKSQTSQPPKSTLPAAKSKPASPPKQGKIIEQDIE